LNGEGSSYSLFIDYFELLPKSIDACCTFSVKELKWLLS
jgi:hypothetical protein